MIVLSRREENGCDRLGYTAVKAPRFDKFEIFFLGPRRSVLPFGILVGSSIVVQRLVLWKSDLKFEVWRSAVTKHSDRRQCGM